MWLLSCDAIPEGMLLGQTVYDEEGMILLRRGTRLTARHLELLVRRGIRAVYVTDSDLNVDVPELLGPKVRAEATRVLREAFASAKAGSAFRAAEVRRVVARVLDDLLAQPFAVHALVDARSAENYTFGHSLMVCALSILMGMSLGYRQDQLFELAMGALLHDIGKARIPSAVLNKPEPLDDAEWELIKAHPQQGFEVLRRAPDVPLPAAHVAYQHHERLDGSGYPRRLVGDQITPYARLVAVADVYDAMTSDRPYRRRMRPDEAMGVILHQAGTRLDRQACSALLRRVAIYPPGTRVALSTGEQGVVTAYDPDFPARPTVRVLTDPAGVPLAQTYELHLKQHPTIKIVDISSHGA